MIRRLFVFSLACAALAGCDGSVSAPPVPSGLFTLDAPAVLRNDALRIEIQSDLLSLFDDGTALREYRQRLDYTAPQGADGTEDVEVKYTYRIQGSRIEFNAACDDIADCMPGPHLWGEVTDTGLALHLPFDPEAVLRYDRIVP